MSATLQATHEDLGWSNIHAPTVGPTEALTLADTEVTNDPHLASVTELHTATEADNTEHDEHQDDPAGALPEPNKELPSEPTLEPPRQPEQLQSPDKPRFAGADLVNTLFYGSIAFSAIGQIMFWGTFFQTFAANAFPGLSAAVPWVIALVLGGVMEAGMVVFSDLGFARRDGRSKAWLPWFLVGVAIACGCIGINVAHWWSDDPTAAITFGAVGAIGFVAHLAQGLNKSQEFINKRTEIEGENRRRWEHYQEQQRRYDDAIEREREHRRRLELSQASARAPATPSTNSEASAKPVTKSTTKRTVQKATSQKGPRKATLADAQKLLRVEENRARIERAEHTVAELGRLLNDEHLDAPHRNTLSKWLPQLGVTS